MKTIVTLSLLALIAFVRPAFADSPEEPKHVLGAPVCVDCPVTDLRSVSATGQYMYGVRVDTLWVWDLAIRKTRWKIPVRSTTTEVNRIIENEPKNLLHLVTKTGIETICLKEGKSLGLKPLPSKPLRFQYSKLATTRSSPWIDYLEETTDATSVGRIVRVDPTTSQVVASFPSVGVHDDAVKGTETYVDCEFSIDGRHLLVESSFLPVERVAGQLRSVRLTLYDIETKRTLGSLVCRDSIQQVILHPTENQVAIQSGAQLKFIPFRAFGRKPQEIAEVVVRRLEVSAKAKAAFNHDGSRLLLAICDRNNDWEYRAIDAQTNRCLAIDHDRFATDARWTTEGRFLIFRKSPNRDEVYDATNDCNFPEMKLPFANALVFSPNGEALWSIDHEYRLQQWDWRIGRHRTSIKLTPPRRGGQITALGRFPPLFVVADGEASFSSDGRWAFIQSKQGINLSVETKESAVRTIIDLSAREKLSAREDRIAWWFHPNAICSIDGRRIATIESPPISKTLQITLRNKNYEPIRTIPWPKRADEKKEEHPNSALDLRGARLTPNGRHLIVPHWRSPDELALRESERSIAAILSLDERPKCRFIDVPEGALLEAGGFGGGMLTLDERRVVFGLRNSHDLYELDLESETGRTLTHPPGPDRGYDFTQLLTPSRDGRLYAYVNSRGDDLYLTLRESLTSQIIREWRMPKEQAMSMAFHPSEPLLAVGFMDGTIQIFETLPKAQAKPQTADEAKALMSDAGHAEAATAFKALSQLEVDPKAAREILTGAVKPIRLPTRTAAEITALIGQLDSPSFKIREAAERELRELGTNAAPAIQRALANQPSEESGVRLEKLQTGLKRENDTKRWLRELRLLGLMERLDLRDEIERISQGYDAPPTREAKRILERMSSRAND